jgi:hypothetical protein
MQHYVTEKYIDTATGNSIPAKPDTVVQVNSGGTYNGTPPNEIGDYKYVGYSLTPTGTPTPGAVAIPNVTADFTIYYHYRYDPDVEISVSKRVTGNSASQSKDFTFSVYLRDGNGTLITNRDIACEGAVIPGSGATAPTITFVTLNSSGEGTFKLRHGQSLKFKGLSSVWQINIIETDYAQYTPSFTDMGVPEEAAATDFRSVGDQNRSIDFLNTRIDIVPTSNEGTSLANAAFVTLAGLFAFAGVAMSLVKRRRQ